MIRQNPAAHAICADSRLARVKNGIICKEDGETLLEIYRAINVWDGSLNRNLTMDEMVFIFALGHAIKENFGEDGDKE